MKEIQPNTLIHSADFGHRVVVFYHGGCNDGFGAAWVCNRFFGDSAELVPSIYGKPPAVDVTDAVVLIVDFSFPRDVMREMAGEAHQITIIDHHEGALKDLEDFMDEKWLAGEVEGGCPVQVVFDIKHSGCVLTWKHLFPQYVVPPLLMYIEDRDLWKFKLGSSKEVNFALSSVPMSLSMWTTLIMNTSISTLVSDGSAIRRWFDMTIERMLAPHYIHWLVIGHKLVPCVNAPPVFVSEIGHRLVELEDNSSGIGCVWYYVGSDVVFGLRSLKGGVNVFKVAQLYGGGGHQPAAGFSVPAIQQFCLDGPKGPQFLQRIIDQHLSLLECQDETSHQE